MSLPRKELQAKQLYVGNTCLGLRYVNQIDGDNVHWCDHVGPGVCSKATFQKWATGLATESDIKQGKKFSKEVALWLSGVGSVKPMQRIEKIEKFLIGKTIKKVDMGAVNGTGFYFTDGTALWMEAEPMGIPGLYGPVYYEIDPNRPIHEQ